jgi:hypothetical protein
MESEGFPACYECHSLVSIGMLVSVEWEWLNEDVGVRSLRRCFVCP